MKFLVSMSNEGEWFYNLSPEDQEAYIEAHPRSKFAHQVGSRGIPPAVSQGTKVVDGVRVQSNGSSLPKHIGELRLPPAWTDVVFNPDPGAALQAVGKDSKGRSQYVYSKAHSMAQAELKFRRIEELNAKFDEISRQNVRNSKSSNPRVKDAADCLKLIMMTGIRPGSEEDTQAEVQAYGATTLQGSHIVQTKSGVELHFVGKKGVNLKIPVTDLATSRMLLKRAREAGPSGKLFPGTNGSHLLAYTHTMDGGSFRTKDFRTHLGTQVALKAVQKMPRPTTQAGYQKAVTEVARLVAKRLGNTPTVALTSYINPTVFGEWRMSSGV